MFKEWLADVTRDDHPYLATVMECDVLPCLDFNNKQVWGCGQKAGGVVPRFEGVVGGVKVWERQSGGVAVVSQWCCITAYTANYNQSVGFSGVVFTTGLLQRASLNGIALLQRVSFMGWGSLPHSEGKLSILHVIG